MDGGKQDIRSLYDFFVVASYGAVGVVSELVFSAEYEGVASVLLMPSESRFIFIASVTRDFDGILVSL